MEGTTDFPQALAQNLQAKTRDLYFDLCEQIQMLNSKDAMLLKATEWGNKVKTLKEDKSGNVPESAWAYCAAVYRIFNDKQMEDYQDEFSPVDAIMGPNTEAQELLVSACDQLMLDPPNSKTFPSEGAVATKDVSPKKLIEDATADSWNQPTGGADPWNQPTGGEASSDPPPPSKPEQGDDADDDDLAALEQLEEARSTSTKLLRRDVYLRIPNPDALGQYLELNTLQPREHFRVRLNLDFDKEQAYVAIQARIDRDAEHVTPYVKYQRLYLRFYRNILAGKGNMVCNAVENFEDLPSGMQKIPEIKDQLEKGSVYRFRIKWDTQNYSPAQEGLHNPILFSGAESLQCHKFMRHVEQSGFVEMYQFFDSDVFIRFFELHKWAIIRELLPWREYRASNNQTQLMYGFEFYTPEFDKPYSRPAFLSFRKLDDFRLTYGYSAMREGGVALEAAVESLKHPMNAMFIEFPGPKNEAGLTKEYVAFVDCQDIEMIRAVYIVGERVTVAFDEPNPEQKPDGWRAEIKPPLPGIEHPGTLVLHMFRPRDDDKVIPTKTSFDLKTVLDTQVWLFPEVSDLSVRRLVNCANLIYGAATPDHIKRYAIGRDLRENESGHSIFESLDHEEPELRSIVYKWNSKQMEAFNEIVETKQPAVYIQGPPGTGKTRFIRDLAKVLSLLFQKVLVTAPSNTAVDTLATTMETKYPEIGAIRYHSWDRERSAIRDHGRPALPKVDVQVDDAAEALSWQLLLQEIRTNKGIWKSAKRSRPNFTTMGLNSRALQLAKVEAGQSSVFDLVGEDPHAEFRDLLNQNAIASVFDDTRTTYKRLERDLYHDTLSKARVVVTTLNNCADNNLYDHFTPQVVIVDEAAQASELESFLPWVHFTTALRQPLAIFVGDWQQLAPTVKSFGMEKEVKGEKRPVNPYAASMKMSHMSRMTQLGHKVIMFTEQYRAVAGIPTVYSRLWYGGKLTNGPGTEVNNRPKAKEAIEYLQTKHGLYDGIPHVFLDVPSGKCMRNAFSQSRYNLHNVVVTINEIRGILEAKLWEQSQIVITTPYRAQATVYRNALRQAGLLQIGVFTTDSFQGKESPCVFWDFVLAKFRKGGWGFVKESARVDVAVSRARDHFVVVGDLKALEPTSGHSKYLEDLDPADRVEQQRMDFESNRYLQGVFEYFVERNMTHRVDPAGFTETSLVNWAEQEAFTLGSTTFTCKNCDKPGHMAKECPEPRRITCRVCDGPHMKAQCPTPFLNTTCRNCGETGHIKATCRAPKQQICGRCHNRGHSFRDCTSENLHPCSKCNRIGHSARDCKTLVGRAARPAEEVEIAGTAEEKELPREYSENVAQFKIKRKYNPDAIAQAIADATEAELEALEKEKAKAKTEWATGNDI